MRGETGDEVVGHLLAHGIKTHRIGGRAGQPILAELARLVAEVRGLKRTTTRSGFACAHSDERLCSSSGTQMRAGSHGDVLARAPRAGPHLAALIMEELPMKRRQIEMPVIQDCAARECAYNTEGSCNARAITVGDGEHPACDTFFARTSHVAKRPAEAGVGACKVSACRHNQDLECTANLVRIGRHAGHAECLTFSPP